MIVMDHHQPINAVAPSSDGLQENNEKTKTWTDVEVDPIEVDEFTDIPASKILIPDDNDEFIDPRLRDYPIPLIA